MDTTWPDDSINILKPTFVGREKELDKLFHWCKNDEGVLFVTGEGGIGKTALIREFERQNNERFEGGIYNISARSGHKGILDTLNKYSFEAELSLIVIDDIEFLSEKSIKDILVWAKNIKSVKLILSGRDVPKLQDIDKYRPFILALSGLDPLSVIKARLSRIDRKTEDKIVSVISNNATLFQSLISTPRAAVQLVHEILKQNDIEPEVVPKEATPTNIVVDDSYNRENQYDYYGYILAMFLFVLSNLSSQESEDRISTEIREFEQVVIELIHSPKTAKLNNTYVVTTFVNFRLTPKIDSNNIITILAPNQHVQLLKIEEGWAHVKYVDYVSEQTIKGWVYASYLKSFDSKHDD